MNEFLGRGIGYKGLPWNVIFTSEWQLFLDALKVCGIPHSWHHMPNYTREEEFQNILKDNGFNLTSHALVGLVVGDVMYVFSTGKAHWTTDEADREARHMGWGPDGAFVFAYNMNTKEVTQRTQMDTSGKSTGLTGYEALASTYGPFPEYTP